MTENGARRDADGLRIGIAVARFNTEVNDALLRGAMDELRDRGARAEAVTVVRVHGAFEVPQALALLAASEMNLDSMIGIGALVRGETPHFDHLAASTAQGMLDVALRSGIPVANGILTCDNGDQARARAGGARGNKGQSAADAAIEMGVLRRRLARG